MKSRRQKQDQIAEQASEWASRLDETDPQSREAFADWITESRRNVEEFLFASAVDKALEGADPNREFDVKRLWGQSNSNVVALEGLVGHGDDAQHGAESLDDSHLARPARNRSNWKPLRSTAAIAACVVAVGFLWWQRPDLFNDWERYSTAVGEQRTVRLADGSLVQLNTQSKLRVRFSAHARELRLIEGEALFQVKSDPTRAFRVDAGSAVVQALGTRFNVYRRGADATVAVIDGSVGIVGERDAQRISAAASADSAAKLNLAVRLSAGQAASIASGGRITTRQKADVERAVAWRQRRLVFERDTLVDIAAEFNRYNRVPQIHVEGDTVRAKRYTGIFDADDPASLMDYLTRDGSLALDRKDKEFWIRPLIRERS